MPETTDSPDRQDPPHVSAQDARGGEIILTSRRRRGIFVGGLVAFVLLALFLTLIAFT